MSGLDYSTFSLCAALTPSPPTSRDLPADANRQHHVVHSQQDVISPEGRHMERDDLPSSSSTADHSRAGSPTLFGSHYDGALVVDEDHLSTHEPSGNPSDDIQGTLLCAQLGNFHFTSQPSGNVQQDEQANATLTITGTSRSLPHQRLYYQYPTPAYGPMSQHVRHVGDIAETARVYGSTPNIPSTYSPSTMMFGEDPVGPDRNYVSWNTFSSATPGSSEGASFTAFGRTRSASPPPTSYDEGVSDADWGTGLILGDMSPVITSQRVRQTSAVRPDNDRMAAQPLFPSATPLPDYISSQSTHDHHIYHPASSSSTAFCEEPLLRPGSAPPLIDNEVPFVGDVRAALQTTTDHDMTVGAFPSIQPHSAWRTGLMHIASPSRSPRSSLRGVAAIGQERSSTTSQTSRHMRRWSSANMSATVTSRSPSSILSPLTQPASQLRRQVPSTSDDSTMWIPPAIEPWADQGQPSSQATLSSPSGAETSPDPAARHVVLCDGCLVDQESVNSALQKSDKLLHVYECFWDKTHSPCGMWIEGDQSSVADHLSHFHGFKGGETTTRCLWHDCPKPHMKGTSIARHVVTHVGFRVKCNTCKHQFARMDACNRAHSRSMCNGIGQPMYGDLQRVLDARKVDPLHHPAKKRRLED